MAGTLEPEIDVIRQSGLVPSMLLKRLIFETLALVGIDRLLLYRIRAGGFVVVLNLHRVSEQPNDYFPPLKPRMFEELIRYVRTRFQITTFANLEAAARSGSRLTPLVLSFDDGYSDFMEEALPLMVKHDLPCNLNVIGSCAVTGKPPWNIRLYDFLQSMPRNAVNSLSLPGFDHRLVRSGYEDRLRFGLAISHFLKSRSQAERLPLWTILEGHMEKAAFQATRMMTVADIREAARAGVEIGSHSYSHESMGFESDQFFADDFEKVEDLFKRQIGLPAATYAFPNGSYRPPQIRYLQSKGVRHILLVEERLSKAACGLYNRLTFYGDCPAEIKLRATGFLSRGVQ